MFEARILLDRIATFKSTTKRYLFKVKLQMGLVSR